MGGLALEKLTAKGVDFSDEAVSSFSDQSKPPKSLIGTPKSLQLHNCPGVENLLKICKPDASKVETLVFTVSNREVSGYEMAVVTDYIRLCCNIRNLCLNFGEPAKKKEEVIESVIRVAPGTEDKDVKAVTRGDEEQGTGAYSAHGKLANRRMASGMLCNLPLASFIPFIKYSLQSISLAQGLNNKVANTDLQYLATNSCVLRDLGIPFPELEDALLEKTISGHVEAQLGELAVRSHLCVDSSSDLTDIYRHTSFTSDP